MTRRQLTMKAIARFSWYTAGWVVSTFLGVWLAVLVGTLSWLLLGEWPTWVEMIRNVWLGAILCFVWFVLMAKP